VTGFVQFIHPGKEQTRHIDGYCPWGLTSQPHGRKFIVNEGRFVRDGESCSGIVGFWGEWEAPTFAADLNRIARGGYPMVVHTIAYYEPESLPGLWDTDPFVFGERFLYNGCQQHTAFNRAGGPSETFLRRLAVGSIVLFGAAIRGRFCVDTVFVVGDFIDYPNGEYSELIGLVPDIYLTIGLRTQKLIEPNTDSYRLYFGATYDEPVGGMYSFTPCRVADDGDMAFERPNIVMSEAITQSLTQGKKCTVINELGKMKKAWDEVVRQVEQGGCRLAHRIELKPIRVR
jgi:hypothetical protein